GLRLVPRPLLQRSAHCQQLEVLPLKDFKQEMDLWLFYPRFLGNLQAPDQAFGAMVARTHKPVSAAAR
ncbi:LysR family transcriptional regulator, partial [Pseudomonas syringae pv. tagetis]